MTETSHPAPTLAGRLWHEARLVGVVTAYFLAWLGALMWLKVLILEEYHIPFHKFSAIVVGALVLSKVVLVLEHVPLGTWLRRQPALHELAARTALYAVGVLLVLLLEKAFEARHEAGGFGPALSQIFQHRDLPHIWANVLCLGGALLSYNLLALVRPHLGPGGLRHLLLAPRGEARPARDPAGGAEPRTL